MSVRDEVMNDLRILAPESFVAKHIFDRVPHVFDNQRSDYVEWKALLASGLGVDAADITIVGSAAVGVSLSPHKAFREFGTASDIDAAIISPYYFQTAWRYFRLNPTKRATLGEKERAAWDDHRQRLIYFGAIATDQLLSRLPFGLSWRRALDAVEAESNLTNEVNVRIYNDYDSLRQYQIKSVRDRRQSILLAEAKNDAEIH